MKYLLAIILIIVYYESSIRLGLYDTEKIVTETIVKEQYITPDDGREHGLMCEYIEKDGIFLSIDLGLWSKVNPNQVEPTKMLIYKNDEVALLNIEKGCIRKLPN